MVERSASIRSARIWNTAEFVFGRPRRWPARKSVTVNIGFGDAIEPGLEEIDLPVLLDLPVPHLRAYARETVIAEKFQAMVALGLADSRMKDFYDVWVLSRTFEFDKSRLALPSPRRSRDAKRKFRRRYLMPLLRYSFATKARCSSGQRLSGTSVSTPPLETVASELAAFIDPHIDEARALVIRASTD